MTESIYMLNDVFFSYLDAVSFFVKSIKEKYPNRKKEIYPEGKAEDGYIEDYTKNNLEINESLNIIHNAKIWLQLQYKHEFFPPYAYMEGKINRLEEELMHIDNSARCVLLSRAVRFSPIQQVHKMYNEGMQNELHDIIFYEYPNRRESSMSYANIFNSIRWYLFNIKELILDYDLYDDIRADEEDLNILLSFGDKEFYEYTGNKPPIRMKMAGNSPTYKTLKSTYRRAAVMALIDKSGLCKNIDRTKKAKFVEAVTGGNINAKPKDTVSYDTPTQQAQEEAKKLLKEIGVNI